MTRIRSTLAAWMRHAGGRLRRDQRGNALILSAALMIPLLALVGSGIDAGRVYVARSRMQQACDSASLAGRWAVSGGKTTDVVTAEALKYFSFNYPQGAYGTATFTPTVNVSGTSTRVVSVSASTTLPMSIMGMFGAARVPVTATCTAQQDYVNTDIVLVLDTTGSMRDPATSGDTDTKIVALRKAVLALYDQLSPIQTQLETAGMRLRYSVVPYSSTVNVGKLLRNVSTDYVRNPANYSQYYCASYDRYGRCTGYAVRSASVDHNSPTTWWANWPGCIEERQTVTTITGSTSTIPSGALDLNITMVPTPDPATRWAPYDTAAQQTNGQTACPVEARRLQAWTRANLSSYLDTLNPDGGTYHDIGMIWGARMISSGGVFSDSASSYNGMPTNKYVIFLTDGLLDTGPSLYSAYGVENTDSRVTGGDLSTQDARHQQRFNLMCSAVKNAGASIWIVAFAATADASLTNCASNAGQVSNSSNSADLIKKFSEIGKNIGALRLTN